MVTINEWFETKDYGIGLVLLAKHCRNRMLLQSLSRRKNPAKLEYELTKIAKQQGIVFDKVGETTAEPPADTLPPIEETEGKIMVSQGKETNIDNLPQHLKAKWNENQNAYKEIRALHEKLKLMEKATPEDRQPLTERIALLDDKIRDNWEKIDNYDPSQEPEPDNQPQKIDHKRINANRKYISTNLKKLVALPEDEKAIAIRTATGQRIIERLIELVNAEEKVSEKTLIELRKLGVKC